MKHSVRSSCINCPCERMHGGYARIDYTGFGERRIRGGCFGGDAGVFSTRKERMCILLSQRPCKAERAEVGSEMRVERGSDSREVQATVTLATCSVTSST